MSIFDYTVIRSSRKTIGFDLTDDGSIIVRAPKRFSDSKIRDYVYSRRELIMIHRAKVKNLAPQYIDPVQLSICFAVKRAYEYIPTRVEYFARIMGLKYTSITITSARRRFGSCSWDDRLCFSWRVMNFPDECVDYVIVHELAHIKHKDHSRAFYDYVASVMPDHKSRRDRLMRGSFRSDLPRLLNEYRCIEK